MDKYTGKCIDGAKEMIFGKKHYYEEQTDFREYSPVYLTTNENIKGYINKFNLDDNTKALSVLASGDHAFNLITCGVKDIDTFDINRLTEYYALGIKRAMILKYSYTEYMQIMSKILVDKLSFDESADIIKSLFPYMEHSHKVFWEEIIDYTHKIFKNNWIVLNVFQCISMDSLVYSSYYSVRSVKNVIKNNNYALNEENYNLLKSRLSSVNITYKQANALNLSKEFNNKYDCILLSNIMDYFYTCFGNDWTYNQLMEYAKSLEPLVNKGGIVQLDYIYSYNLSSNIAVDASSIKISDLPADQLLILKKKKGQISNNKNGVIIKRYN